MYAVGGAQGHLLKCRVLSFGSHKVYSLAKFKRVFFDFFLSRCYSAGWVFCLSAVRCVMAFFFHRYWNVVKDIVLRPVCVFCRRAGFLDRRYGALGLGMNGAVSTCA